MATKTLIGGGGLKVNVVTPKGPVTDATTDAITAPGEMGEFEVLAGHIPFLTAMHPGVLTLGENMKKQIYAVGAGYLRVDQAGSVEVLVERAIAAEDVDTEAAGEELKELRPQVEGWKGAPDADFLNLKARYDWARARIDANAATRHG